MKTYINFCKEMRKIVEAFTQKWMVVCAGIIVLAYIAMANSYEISPWVAVPTGFVVGLVLLIMGIQPCLHSCIKLIAFFFVDGILFTTMAVYIFDDIMPITGMMGFFIQYVIFIAVYTVFWVVSAGIVDRDIAEMTCAIINSLSTILLLASNVFFDWCERAGILEVFASTSAIETQVVSKILLPVVVAGYVTALIIKRVEYLESHKSEGAEMR